MESIADRTMTLDEAESAVAEINSAAGMIGQRLLALKRWRGWEALGYPNWTAFLEGEFAYTRKHLYELMRAAPVEENLSHLGYKINLATADLLSHYEPEIQPMIVQTAVSRYGQKPTEGQIRRTADVLTQIAVTGHVDVGSGQSSAFDGAMSAAEKADHDRRMDHMTAGKPLPLVDAEYEALDFENGNGFQITGDGIELGRRYRVRVYPVPDASGSSG